MRLPVREKERGMERERRRKKGREKNLCIDREREKIKCKLNNAAVSRVTFPDPDPCWKKGRMRIWAE